MSIQDVLDHHMEALAAGDVDEVIKDYTDDAVLITAGMGSAEGIAAIKTAFAMIPSEMFNGFELTETTIAGSTAMVTWKADALSFGTDTFVFDGDKITAQTVAFSA